MKGRAAKLTLATLVLGAAANGAVNIGKSFSSAGEELERLGCGLNDSPSRTVLIPGPSGALEDGYC